MTSLLSAAKDSIQLIVTAYYLVKTNKEKCRGLVERCQTLVAALQEVVDQRGEDIDDQERIERLQEAFEHIAFVIKKVGTRNWFTMYWQSDHDGNTIDSCHHRITDLIILFNLRELVDTGNSQTIHYQLQAAITRQHGEELVRIQSVNRDINRQLGTQHQLLRKLARRLSISTIATEDSLIRSRIIQWSPNSLKLIQESSSIPSGTPQNIAIHASQERATKYGKKVYQSPNTARVYPSATPSSTTSPPPKGGDQLHTPSGESAHVSPSSDLNLSEISHRAVYGSEASSDAESDVAHESEMQYTPRAQKKSLYNHPHDGAPMGAPMRVTGAGEVEAPREVEVYFVPDVADTGALLDQAELVGRTNKFLVRSWTDAPEIVSQTLRPESGIIVLRLLPTTNPYSILPPLVKSVPDGPISSHEYLSPIPPNSNTPSYFVYLVESHAPVLLVLVTHNGSTIDRVIFPWSPEETTHQLKAKLTLLLRRPSDHAHQSSSRRCGLFRSSSSRSSRWRGVEVDPKNIRFTVVGSLYTNYLNETEELGSTELADGGNKLRGGVSLVPGRFLKAEVSFRPRKQGWFNAF